MTLLTEAGTLTQQGGKFLLQIISPGQGSSGTYPTETLKRAADERVFRAGTLSFIDHQTDSESWERPEGSIRDLAAVLEEDARWDEGRQALVAPARVFEHWRPTLESMRDSIGVSIRATGEVEETADGPIITRLTHAHSVDFVTKAGRGGRILEVLEAERPATLTEITDMFRTPHTSQPPAGGEPNQESQEGNTMGDITLTESAHAELQEKASRVDALEAQLTDLTTKLTQFEEAKAKADRHAHVTTLIEAEFEGVDDPAGMAGLLIAHHTITESDDTVIIAEAKDRAAKLTPTSTVKGLGESAPLNESKTFSDEDTINALEGR